MNPEIDDAPRLKRVDVRMIVNYFVTDFQKSTTKTLDFELFRMSEPKSGRVRGVCLHLVSPMIRLLRTVQHP